MSKATIFTQNLKIKRMKSISPVPDHRARALMRLLSPLTPKTSETKSNTTSPNALHHLEQQIVGERHQGEIPKLSFKIKRIPLKNKRRNL